MDLPFTPQAHWTLFLDRDGVINVEKNNDYILSWEEFHFYPQALAALPLLAQCFAQIVVVTNQKGVGKGLMTEASLLDIHARMQAEIAAHGGRIDAVLYCTDMDDASPNRKPQAGMAYQAQALFPAIHLAQSIMVGNRFSDMKFGRNAGMKTVFLATTHPEMPFPDPLVDARFNDLLAFAQACTKP